MTNFTLLEDCTPHMPDGRVASEQDTWLSMENIIQTIQQVTRSQEWNRAFFNPNLEVSRPVIQVQVGEIW